MQIKLNSQIFKLRYHKSGSLNGNTPTYWYLDEVRSEGMALTTNSYNLQIICSTKHDIAERGRAIAKRLQNIADLEQDAAFGALAYARRELQEFINKQ